MRELAELALDGGPDLGVGVAQVEGGHPRGHVEEAPSIGGPHPGALAADDLVAPAQGLGGDEDLTPPASALQSAQLLGDRRQRGPARPPAAGRLTPAETPRATRPSRSAMK